MRDHWVTRQGSGSAGVALPPSGGPTRRTEPRVLIIDDSRLDVMAVQRAFASLGIRAAVLPGFVRALVRVRSHRDPLDLVTAVVDGPEGLAFLREAGRLRRDVRFVALVPGGRSDGDEFERLGRATVALDAMAPASEIAAAGRELLAVPAERPRPTILLVDGNPSQRRANQQAFRHLDHDCIGLSTAEQALSLARRKGVRLDAIVVASRPGGGQPGGDLARALSSIRPSVPWVILEDHTDESAAETGAIQVFERPFTPDSAAQHVIELIHPLRRLPVSRVR